MRSLTSIACALSLLAATGFAQTSSFGPTGGQSLFSIGGSISRQTIDTSGGDFKTTSFNAQVGFGYFMTDVHEFGATLNESYSDPDPGSKTVTTGVSPYYNYNFRQNPRTWFYVGPHLGLLYIKSGGSDDTNIAFGVHGGVRHWLTESAALFAEARATRSEFDGDDVDTEEIIFGYSVVL